MGAQDNELSGTLDAFADALVFAPHASVLRYLSLSGNRLEGGVPSELSRIAAFKPGPWRAPARCCVSLVKGWGLARALRALPGSLAAACKRPGKAGR